MLFVGPACGEYLAKGFALASARTDQGWPLSEAAWLLSFNGALGLAFLCTFSQFAHKTPRRQTAFLGVQLRSLVSVFQAWKRTDESQSQPARVMMEKIVRKIAESCRADIKLETDLKISCLIPG